jgi:hypothetical protein
MEHPPYSPDLVPNDFWLFPKVNSVLKERWFSGYWRHPKKCDDGTESYSTTGVPKIFTKVAALLG